MDGTLLEAWAKHKGFRPIEAPARRDSDDDPSNPGVNFRGEKRSSTTHRSVTDPDARLARKSSNTGAMLACQASVLMENRHGLIVQTDGRTTRHRGDELSQRKRQLVEEGFGWAKCAGLLRKLHHRGRERVGWIFTFTSAAYNLVRRRSLLAVT